MSLQVLVGSVNGTVKTFSTDKGIFTATRECGDASQGRFTGLAVTDRWFPMSSYAHFYRGGWITRCFVVLHWCNVGMMNFLSSFSSSMITCVESGLLKVWKEGSTETVSQCLQIINFIIMHALVWLCQSKILLYQFYFTKCWKANVIDKIIQLLHHI